jgi:hypothetical protein
MALVSFRALTSITAGQPVTVGSSGTIYPSSAATLSNAKCIGTLGRAISASGLNIEVARPVSTSLSVIILEGSGAVGALLAETGVTIDLE